MTMPDQERTQVTSKSLIPVDGIESETEFFRFKPETASPVYHALADHQVDNTDWELSKLLSWLQLWAVRFNDRFQLDLAEISLRVDWLRSHCLGHFRYGENGFGLKGEVAINRRYLHQQQPYQILGTLLHELLHAWQDIHGKPGKGNYHNKEFREKARSYGLIIDTKGHQQEEPNSPFFQLLEEFGVDAPSIPPIRYVTKGSKLKKWTCQCDPPINVRVAVPHFYAQCLWCGHNFSQDRA